MEGYSAERRQWLKRETRARLAFCPLLAASRTSCSSLLYLHEQSEGTVCVAVVC